MTKTTFFKRAAIALMSIVIYFLLYLKMEVEKSKSFLIAASIHLIGAILLVFSEIRGEKKSVAPTSSNAGTGSRASIGNDKVVDAALDQQNNTWLNWLWNLTPAVSSSADPAPSPSNSSSHRKKN